MFMLYFYSGICCYCDTAYVKCYDRPTQTVWTRTFEYGGRTSINGPATVSAASRRTASTGYSLRLSLYALCV